MLTKEQRREKEQYENAMKDLKIAKDERENKRRLQANRYGILDRQFSKARERQEWIKKNCTCGAVKTGFLHTDECPVAREAKSNR